MNLNTGNSRNGSGYNGPPILPVHLRSNTPEEFKEQWGFFGKVPRPATLWMLFFVIAFINAPFQQSEFLGALITPFVFVSVMWIIVMGIKYRSAMRDFIAFNFPHSNITPKQILTLRTLIRKKINYDKMSIIKDSWFYSKISQSTLSIPSLSLPGSSMSKATADRKSNESMSRIVSLQDRDAEITLIKEYENKINFNSY